MSSSMDSMDGYVRPRRACKGVRSGGKEGVSMRIVLGVRARDRRLSVDRRGAGRFKRAVNKVDFPTKGEPIIATFPSISSRADLIAFSDSGALIL